MGDIKEVLQVMLGKVKTREQLAPRQKIWGEWRQHIMAWKQEKPLPYQTRGANGEILPRAVLEEINQITGGEAIVVTDVGQHQMWAAQMMKFSPPRSWLTSGGLGTMGYGLPAGIGAHFAAPDRQVVVISGDGSIQMNIQELFRCRPISCSGQGYHSEQPLSGHGPAVAVRKKFYEERYSHSYMDAMPDFVKLAEAYGAKGFRAEKSSELSATLRAAFAEAGTVLVEVVIPKSRRSVSYGAGRQAPCSEMLFA